jgi:2-amino-4-hydroxy-6-hydroxymethyldihydropteridine diphosphokinase
MECLLAVEVKMGRIRTQKFSARNIDIDLLLYNNEVKQSEFLTLPHLFLTERRFALQPLAEIAPHIIHPIKKKTIETLLHECYDTLTVQKISSFFP